MQKQIIYKFIKQFKDSHPKDKIDVIEIIGFGSIFSEKKLSPNSDFDIYIVIKNIGKRYRGNMFIDGIEIDYFVNPIEQLKADFERVKNKSIVKKTICYILRDGKIFLDKNGELKKLKKEAREFLKNDLKNSTLSNAKLVIAKYFISDYLKDIEDCFINKDVFSWQYNIATLLNYLIEIFCQFHKIPLIKQKYQCEEIAKKDKKFIKLYEMIAKTSSIEEKNLRIKKLALYVLKSLGGKLSKEWELESSVF